MLTLVFIKTYTKSAKKNVGMDHLLVVIGSVHERIHGVLRPGTIAVVGIGNGGVKRSALGGMGLCLAYCVVVLVMSVLLISVSGFSFTAAFDKMLAAVDGMKPNVSGINPIVGFRPFSTLSGLMFYFSVLVKELRVFPCLLLLSPRL